MPCSKPSNKKQSINKCERSSKIIDKHKHRLSALSIQWNCFTWSFLYKLILFSTFSSPLSSPNLIKIIETFKWLILLLWLLRSMKGESRIQERYLQIQTWKLATGFLFCLKSVNNKVRLQNIEDVKRVFQPKTQVALAASNGLFSAWNFPLLDFFFFLN